MATAVSLLVAARRHAGLSQRQLTARTGIAQASVSRIERGLISPRASTIEEWLSACGMMLDARPIQGAGIDRTTIRERLAMTPTQRSTLGVQEAESLLALRRGRLLRRYR